MLFLNIIKWYDIVKSLLFHSDDSIDFMFLRFVLGAKGEYENICNLHIEFIITITVHA